MTLTAESFTGRVLAAFSRRSPGFRPPYRHPAPRAVSTRTRPATALGAVPHLLDEDRPDFENVLDEALRIVLGRGHTGRATGTGLRYDDGSASGATPFDAEQLRALALSAADPISVRAAAEYDTYRTLRETAHTRDDSARGYAAAGIAASADLGAGLVAVVAVLVPLLAGTVALIFLITGYAMSAVHPQPGVAAPLRTTGWFFAAVTGASILLGAVGLLVTALRDRPTTIHVAPDDMPPDVHAAREAWHQALLDRGLLPFLDDALHDPAAPATPSSAPRSPRLGYSRPDFSAPQDPHRRPTEPRFTSPDFATPDLGGPDHEPE
ncbi:hypothetical protein [Streptomyces sp. NPDC021224]|uniref:hypothetical protein n=1 Tax=unclassified Streptomyces TaxID=2593676 RepID=UPI0037B6EF9E